MPMHVLPEVEKRFGIRFQLQTLFFIGECRTLSQEN